MKRYILSLNYLQLALIIALVIILPPFITLDAITNIKKKVVNKLAKY